MDKNLKKSERLVKYIALCGIASRRKAGDIVKDRRIKVNGIICDDMSKQIFPNDIVELDNKIIKAIEKKFYIMLNKPTGYVCTNEDIHAELKAVDLIKLETDAKLFSVGRLDKDSEGLIIFTNDGDFALKLSHPRYQILKHYIVTTNKPLTIELKDKLIQGVISDGENLHAERIDLLPNYRAKFILNEGKKREIRRLCQAVNLHVVSLKRMKIGKLELGNLEIGKFRELNETELQLLFIN